MQRSVIYPESNVVVKRIVKQYGLLINVADKLTQVVHTQIFHIDAVDKHFALLYIIVAWYEIYQSRLSRTTLSHQSHALSLAYG